MGGAGRGTGEMQPPKPRDNREKKKKIGGVHFLGPAEELVGTKRSELGLAGAWNRNPVKRGEKKRPKRLKGRG